MPTTEPAEATSGPVPTHLGRDLAARLRAASQSPEAASEYFEAFRQAGPEGENLLIKLHDGDLARTTQEALLDRIEPTDLLRREAIRRRLGQVQVDLLGPGPGSAVERLLVDRVVACWLAVQEAEARVARLAEPSSQGFAQKRLDHAQKRFLDVVKALDTVRRKTPAAHRLSVQVLGDLTLSAPPPAEPTPPVIELASSPD